MSTLTNLSKKARQIDCLRKNPLLKCVGRALRVNEKIEQSDRAERLKKSETGKCRHRLAKYCTGNGVDIGFGGDKIVPSAVSVDMYQPYAKYKDEEPNLKGDARDLCWFSDGVLDYVYSSHLLEDFTNTEEILREWLRVLKPGGKLILYCPDQQAYVADCKRLGKIPNKHHRIDDFSLGYVVRILDKIGQTKVIYSDPHTEVYSFDLVAEKIETAL